MNTTDARGQQFLWDNITTPADGLATWKRIEQIKAEIGRLQFELMQLESQFYSKQFQYSTVNYNSGKMMDYPRPQ